MTFGFSEDQSRSKQETVREFSGAATVGCPESGGTVSRCSRLTAVAKIEGLPHRSKCAKTLAR